MPSVATARALLEVKHLKKSFGLGPLRQQVLGDCSFTLQPERLTVLIGPSGCGKSSLVNIVAGYEPPDAGEVTLLGEPVRGPSAKPLVVVQETALFPWMTAFHNVLYGPMVQRNRAIGNIEAETISVLENADLKEFREQYPTKLYCRS